MAGLLSAAQLANITTVVASSLDTPVAAYRKTTVSDGYGHKTETYPGTPTFTANVNTYKPSASTLQTFAGIIGSSQALMMRFLSTDDFREGDRVVLFGLNWVVQNVQKAESYTVAYDALITTVT
jgi:hypothetical protein